MSKKKIPGITCTTKEVPIDSIVENSWNPNEQSEFTFEQTCKVIEEFGFLDPCTVRAGREKGKLFKKPQIIDGAHRWRAAKKLGLTHVLVLDVGRMSDAKARTLTDIMNNLKGENNPIKWLEMVMSIKKTDEDMLQYLPYQQSELESMMQTTEVDWSQFEGGLTDRGETEQDENGELYKRFSVSVSKATMTRASDLMRKVKAAHGLDNDSAAFEHILDGFESYVASQGELDAPNSTENDPKPRAPARSRKRKKAA